MKENLSKENKIYNFFEKAFLFIYTLFAIFLIVSFIFTNHGISSNLKYLFVILIATTFVIIIKNKSLINLNKIFWLLIAISLIFYFILPFLKFNTPTSDYATFYYNAINFSQTFRFSNAKYIAIFPHLNGYIMFLGLIMKLTTTKYFIVVLTNIFFNYLGSFIIYKIFANQNHKELGRIATLVWLFNPINYSWCVTCIPIIIFQTMFLISIYMFELLIKNINKSKKYLVLSLITGIIAGISNLFRPIMIIYLIAIIIYYIFVLFFYQKEKWYLLLISFLIIVIPYSLINKTNIALLSYVSEYETTSTPGWSFYVGSIGNGEWSTIVGNEFGEYSSTIEKSTMEFHNEMFQKALQNYKEKGFQIPSFMITKFRHLTSNINSLTGSLFYNHISNAPIIIEQIINYLSILFIALCLVLSLTTIIIYRKNNNNKIILFYALLIIGITMANLLLEVSPRYFIPVFVPLILLGLSFFNINQNLSNKNIINNFKSKRNKKKQPI